MGTKNKPAIYDCLAKADPDEPYFVLLGRDATASLLVVLWAETRKRLGEADKEQIAEARTCAQALRAWAVSQGKDPRAAAEAFGEVVAAMTKVAREELDR